MRATTFYYQILLFDFAFCYVFADLAKDEISAPWYEA
jgi:hypothetical protein